MRSIIPTRLAKETKSLTAGLAPQPKQINKQNLADVASIGKVESAERMWRRIKAKINDSNMPSGSDTGGPSTATTPATPGDGSTAAVAAADPGSPSLLASKKKKAAAGGKVAGRKRTMKEADGDDDDDDMDLKKEADGGERPKKASKRVKAATVVTSKEEPDEGAVDLKAGEV